MALAGVGYDGVDCIGLAQDRDNLWAPVVLEDLYSTDTWFESRPITQLS
jgi:hypothetical protein